MDKKRRNNGSISPYWNGEIANLCKEVIEDDLSNLELELDNWRQQAEEDGLIGQDG
jgi:hypothetical protein